MLMSERLGPAVGSKMNKNAVDKILVMDYGITTKIFHSIVKIFSLKTKKRATKAITFK